MYYCCGVILVDSHKEVISILVSIDILGLAEVAIVAKVRESTMVRKEKDTTSEDIVPFFVSK